MYKLFLMVALTYPFFAISMETAKSINLAAFQKPDKNTEFEGVIKGKILPFLTEMKRHKMLAIIHTEGAYDGDVITLQSSVLHNNEGGLGDYGLDCQLSFTEGTESGETYYSLGGICRINRIGHGKSDKFVLVIPPTPIPDTEKEGAAWYLFDEDEGAGVAFYVNIGRE